MKKTLVISKYVLTDEKLNKYMEKKYFKQYISAKQTGEKLSHVLAENLASAIKKWAIKHGATHFTHWFFPLNNAVAEKYVNFTESDIKGNSIELASIQCFRFD